MLENEFHISALLIAHLQGTLSAKQQEELNAWVELSSENRILWEEMNQDKEIQTDLEMFQSADRTAVWNKTMYKIGAVEHTGSQNRPARKVIAIKKLRSLQWVAIAASVILVLGILAVVFNYAGKNRYQALDAKNDVAAGGNKAYLTFGTGKKINLSSDKSVVMINPSKLAYNDGTEITANTGENITIATPMGGTYQVVLPDGTKVWLNAASTIQFPAAFAKNIPRTVILTGEAYFEVSKDAKHPFIVKTEKQNVTVLGTHFNINSYADENTTTTLLEGSVQITSPVAGYPRLLKPGEQAINTGNKIAIQQADIEQAIAWKNGFFRFKEESLESIMRKISRWYNVEVVYATDSPRDVTLAGIISRNKNILSVLEMMTLTENVRFKVEGRRITVLKYNN